MAGKRNAEKAALWRETLRRQASSGLSIQRFCEQEGVSAASFYAWRRKLGRPTRRARKSSAVRVANSAGSQFIPLSLAHAPIAMEVVHPLGYRVRLPGDVNSDTLALVFEAIDRSQNR